MILQLKTFDQILWLFQRHTYTHIIINYYYYFGSTSLCWASAAFSVSRSYTQSVELLGRGGSARRKAFTYTQNNTNTE
jgi:hypothetical protein